MTNAQYFRNFILNHPDYKHNSVITEEINYDLMKHIVEIQEKKIRPKELFGEF